MLSHTWTRIALSFAGLLVITAAVLGLLLGGEIERRSEDALRARLADQAHAVANAAAPLLVNPNLESGAQDVALELGALFGTRVTIVLPDGTVVADSAENPAVMENHLNRPEVLEALRLAEGVSSSSRVSATVHRRLLYVATAVHDPGSRTRVVGVARVAYPMTSVEQSRDALWRNLALTILLVSVPAALVAVLFARSIAGPLTHLGEVARRFGEGDLRARARITSRDEIGELARELNSTADRLSAVIRERTEGRNRMAAVLEHMHDGIILTDPQGRIESMNPAAARLFGVKSEAWSGKKLIELTRDHDLHNALQQTLSTPVDWQRLEIEVGRHTISAVVTDVPGPHGGDPTGLVVLQDVTELRRLERVRRDFVANIGHELRTPLSSIKLLVETLMTAVDDDPGAAKDFLSRIDVEVDGLTQLVRELLELSRIESGSVQLSLQAVDVAALLERAAGRLRAQAARAGLSLEVGAEPELPRANSDPERVEQVLVNLLHNAVKFTDPGGSIRVLARPEGATVEISIADTGIGIPPDDLPRIFERFYKVDKSRTQGREGGTGLGLAIAKHIVQAHGGRIWAEHRDGGGTVFRFTLPAFRGEPATPPDVNNC
jgi:two-component system phosphate regulon sensor histidine kinase PhoR